MTHLFAHSFFRRRKRGGSKGVRGFKARGTCKKRSRFGTKLATKKTKGSFIADKWHCASLTLKKGQNEAGTWAVEDFREIWKVGQCSRGPADGLEVMYSWKALLI